MSLDRPTRSVRLLQTYRTSEDERRSSHANTANQTNKLKICMIMYILPRLGEK